MRFALFISPMWIRLSLRYSFWLTFYFILNSGQYFVTNDLFTSSLSMIMAMVHSIISHSISSPLFISISLKLGLYYYNGINAISQLMSTLIRIETPLIASVFI